MKSLDAHSMQWAQILRKLENNPFQIVYAPFDYNRGLFTRFLHQYMMEKNTVTVELELYDLARPESIHNLWQSIQSQLALPEKKIKNEAELVVELGKVFSSYVRKILVIIKAEGKGKEREIYSMTNFLYGIISARGNEEISENLSILILDDYTLYFFEQFKTEFTSRWDYFKRVELFACKRDQVLTQLPPGMNRAEEWADAIIKYTGGHWTLVADVAEALAYMPAHKNESLPIEEQVESILMESEKLSRITNWLSQNAGSVIDVCKEYAGKRVNGSSKEMMSLIQQGVILKTDALYSICPRIIIKLIEEIEASAPASNIEANFAGELTDDDIVLLHLSDIHIGDKFSFKIEGDNDSLWNRSLEDLFISDIKKLQLAGKIDALIISGDFTESASWDEFLRARDLVLRLLNTLQLQKDKLFIVPGNHDVQWNAGKLNNADPKTRISRDNYNAFWELLKSELVQAHKSTLGEITSLASIPSKSGNNKVNLLGLDSNSIEGPDASGIGFISNESFKHANEFVTDLQWPTIIITHHHVFPATSPRADRAFRKKVSLMANASRLLDFATDNNIGIILHGHEHQPSVCATERWSSGNESYKMGSIVSLGAGSFGGNEDITLPYTKNHYYILCIKKEKLMIKSRSLSYSAAGFQEEGNFEILTANRSRVR